MGGMYRMQDLLMLVAHERAEELRLEPGRPPIMVLHGKARVMDGELVTSDNIAELFHSIASEEQNQELVEIENQLRSHPPGHHGGEDQEIGK